MRPQLHRSSSRCGVLVAVAVLAGSTMVSERSASAQQTPPADGSAVASQLDRARAAYDRGVRAHAAHDHVAAARAFAEADALAPSPASLEAALESSMRADDVVLGAELVERAEGRPGDPGVARSLAAAKKRFGGRTGKLEVDCRREEKCIASVDGVAVDARRAIHATAGPHAVVVQRGDERLERLVEVKPGTVEVVGAKEVANTDGAAAGAREGERPRKGERAREGGSDGGRGVSPVWFLVAIGATAVVGGITIGSGIDAVNKHDAFVREGCGVGGTGARPADCGTRGDDGESAQVRTNALIGVTAVLAAATVAVGLFVVTWKDGSSARLTLGATRTAATAGFELLTP